ncbi:MAG: thioredoxin [Lachnospiraceae bacterium]|nr:thioredoxin [Lachnospiraceae bacterium]
MAVIEVTKDNFEAEVLQSEVPVLADFNAEWCGPCKSMRPMLDELAEGNADYKIVSINIDDEDELAEDYDVTSIPCLVVFKGGEEVNRSVGLIPRDAIAALVEG